MRNGTGELAVKRQGEGTTTRFPAQGDALYLLDWMRTKFKLPTFKPRTKYGFRAERYCASYVNEMPNANPLYLCRSWLSHGSSSCDAQVLLT